MYLGQERGRYRMKKIIVTMALFAILSIAASGCGSPAATQKSTDFGNENSQKGFSSKGSLTASDTPRYYGKKIRLMIIDTPGGPPDSANAIKKLRKIINSGKYNIIKINTIYNGDGYFAQAEIYYMENDSSK